MFTRVAEWPNALVCKTSQPRVRIPPRVPMKENMTNRTKSVEMTREASRLCQRLFPQWSKPPFMGELQNIILLGQDKGLDELHMSKAGMWWLWVRNLAIENTLTREAKTTLWQTAISTSPDNPVNIVTTRSPELLHAIIGKGDLSLPRSRSALQKISGISSNSNQFLPTKVTVIFADLAIDNFEAIKSACNIDQKIEENIQTLHDIIVSLDIVNIRIVKLSELFDPPKAPHPPISIDGWKKIEIAHKGSFESQQRKFGWSEERARQHNTHLAITMGLAGQAIKQTIPHAIMIHNEAFIERGALNNLFTPPNDPLPVICLNDLLKNKKAKL